jgi:hypothetical protein
MGTRRSQVNAKQISDGTNQIQRRHRLLHPERMPGCEVCFLLTALQTAVGRRWDPFSGGPIPIGGDANVVDARAQTTRTHGL